MTDDPTPRQNGESKFKKKGEEGAETGNGLDAQLTCQQTLEWFGGKQKRKQQQLWIFLPSHSQPHWF